MISLQSVPIQQLMSFSENPKGKDHKFGSDPIKKDDFHKFGSVSISPAQSSSSDSVNTPDVDFPYQSPLSA